MTKERLAEIELRLTDSVECHAGEDEERLPITISVATLRGLIVTVRERDKKIAKLHEAVERCANHLGCGDNSCVFIKPTGMATNGGCRCIESARPGVHSSLGYLFRVAKETTSE